MMFFDHIATDNPNAALAIHERLFESVDELLTYPKLGRPGRVDGTRELVVTRTPFIVAYEFDTSRQRIYIHAVVHGAQLWPREFPVTD